MQDKIHELYNSLNTEEVYDCTKLNVWSFKKSNDIIEGIQMNLSNMSGGYPFVFNDIKYNNNEILYLSGEFSENTIICNHIQWLMLVTKSGYEAKRFVKNKYKENIRKDFNSFRSDWMLYVVWQKCLGNEDFRNKLLSIPDNVILVEDTSTSKDITHNIWGASNKELIKKRKEIEEEIINNNTFKTKKKLKEYISIETNKVRNIGTFIGQNNMGKILMICKECIKQNVEPPVNKELLNNSNIYIHSKLIKF